MKNRTLRLILTLASLALAVSIAIPVASIANSEQSSLVEAPVLTTETQPTKAVGDGNGDCTLTVKYYEGVWYDDPDVEVDEDSRVFLGEHVVTGLYAGDVIDAWDYVVDIPGHVFFDGWPATITISPDPAQNELTLVYAKLWNSEFTVNYYLMVGADLTADNWTDALKPETVEFIKLGSQKFEDQRFDSLVKGDAYEYLLDGMYVIDTYPAQIRLDVNPDNNVLNVLYTPDSVNLPDDMEIYDMTTLPDDFEIVELPEATAPEPDEPGDDAGDDAGEDAGDSVEGTLPDDTTISKDDLIALLPDSFLVPDGIFAMGSDDEGDLPSSGNASTGGSNGNVSAGGAMTSPSEIVEDFVGTDIGEGELVITDEMLANPLDRGQAEDLRQAYKSGVHQSYELAKTGDVLRFMPYVIVGLIAIVIIVICAFLLRRRKDPHGE